MTVKYRPHGKKGRYTHGCRCTMCTAWAGHRTVPDEVRWPFYFVREHRELIEQWFTPEEVEDMRARGLDDATADTVAVKLFGVMPYQIWPGWLERGLDPDVE